MGYTGTTNYGFQKPAKENAFTVDDLNNALDKIDETIKTQSVSSVELTSDYSNLIIKINMENKTVLDSFPFANINSMATLFFDELMT